MKREDLKALGLSDEHIETVMKMHGEVIESHKTKLSTAQTESKTLKDQLTEANKQIEGFKGMDVDSIKKTAEDYKTKFEQAQTESAAQLLAVKRGHALERDLKEVYKVKDIKAVKAHLNDETIQFNEKDETFIGLKEQVDPLKSEKDYLFDDGKVIPKIVTNTNNKTIHIDPFEAGLLKGAKLTPDEGK